jgi:hypothetical protein
MTIPRQHNQGQVSAETPSRKDAILNNLNVKPMTLPIIPENIPQELKALAQWIVWRFVVKEGRWTKPPYQTKANAFARVNDETTWSTFDEALAAVHAGKADGLGCVLRGGAGIDLDDCVSADGDISDWAQVIIDRADTYVEISPTGTGVKLFMRGKLPAGRRRRGHIEMYDENSSRYFTVTGHRLPGSPTTVSERQTQLEALHGEYLGEEQAAEPAPKFFYEANGSNLDDDALIAKAMAAKGGEKFRALWSGELNGHPSHSEADADLVCRLVWWTQHDAECVDRLFRRSGLMRAKWDEGHSGDGRTFGQMTIESALATVAGDYDPGSNRANHTPPPHEAAKAIDVQDVQLLIIDARQTKSKIVATVAIIKAGARIDLLTVSSATSARQVAAKVIAKHIANPDQLEIDIALGQLILEAANLAIKVRVRTGETVREIVARFIVEDLRPAYRTPGGFFSESRGQEIRRQDLIGYTPSRLMDLAEGAVDAPLRNDGTIIRTSLLKSIKAELEIKFSDLMQTLPVATDADLAEKSAAGREFVAAFTRMLTLPKTWESAANGAARRASVLSRAATAINSHLTHRRSATRSWKRIIDACACWWRISVAKDGEIIPLMAARWELAHQIGVVLPGVTDQASFVSLGIKFGVLDPAPPANERTSHNSVRLAVIKREFIDPLLADAGDILDADDGACGHPPRQMWTGRMVKRSVRTCVWTCPKDADSRERGQLQLLAVHIGRHVNRIEISVFEKSGHPWRSFQCVFL